MSPLRTLAVLAGAAAPAHAQNPAQHIQYQFSDPRIPLGLTAGADLDGDAVPDAVGAWRGRNMSITETANLTVISGRTGVERTLPAFPRDRLGTYLAMLGDLDGDGGSEFAAGAPGDATRGPDTGAVYVVSGRTLQRLTSWIGVQAGDQLGPCAQLADLDGDGTPEFAIAAPGSDFPGPDAGAVFVVSGRSLTITRSHLGSAGQRLGEHMLGIEDQDRDGVADYALSVRSAGNTALEITSGRTGARLFTATMPVAGAIETLAQVGDTDNDGRADFAVGIASAPQGSIVVLSGNGAGVLLTLNGQGTASIGRGIATAGDYDGDRRADLAVVERSASAHVVTVRSGRTGLVLNIVVQTVFPVHDNVHLAAAGDLNRDGNADVFAALAGQPNSMLAALSTRPLALTTQRFTAPVGQQVLQTMLIDAGAGAANQAFLALSSVSGNAPGFAIGPVRVPLNPDPVLFAALTSPNQIPFVTNLGVLNGLGRAVAVFGLFTPPVEFTGITVHHAALRANASNNIVGATNAVPLTFVNPLAPGRTVEETFASDAQLDRARSGGPRFGDLGFVGGTGLHGDFDYRVGVDRGASVFEFDLQRDARGGVLGFAIPATHTLSGREEFVTDGAFQFATFTVPSGITVRFVGTMPVRVLVRGEVAIDGTLDVSGDLMPQVPNSLVAQGQRGGRGGAGGGRGGDGADPSNGSTVSNGQNGSDVRVVAGHAYAGNVFGTGGRGGLQFPASNALVTHNYLTQCAQVVGGAGGGGFVTAGGTGIALRSPATPPELGPPGSGGIAFALFPIPSPRPATFDHFLVGGAGGGGGGSHIYGHRLPQALIWRIGAGGSGGGGALGLRAGHDLLTGSASGLRARGGSIFVPYLHQIQGPPGPSGGGSGGSFVLQSATRVLVTNLDARGAPGLWVQPGTTQGLFVETRGGDGGDGFYRVESPATQIVNAQPPQSPNNVGPLLDRDAQAGQQSKWYPTETTFVARFVRFEIEAVRAGVNLRFSDVASFGPAPRFGDASAALWFKLQGGRLDAGGNFIAGSQGPWRDVAADLDGDGANAFRFVILRNDAQIRVTRVRVVLAE